MIIDFHTHVGKDESGESLSFDDLKKSMDRWKIDKSVVFSFSNSNKQMIEQSLVILKESKENNWIIPFLRFNPNSISKNELIELLNKEFKGIKLHPSAQKFKVNDENFFWIYDLCEKKNLPILFHCSAKDREFSNSMQVLEVVKKFPNLKVVMAHFFGNDFELMKKASEYKNLYVDVSVNSGTLKRNQAVNNFNFKNFLFASDAPYDSQGVSLLKINEAGLDNKDKELIFSGNAKKILNL